MLSYDQIGQGTPLVLIPAFPLSRNMWKPNRTELSQKFRVISIDLPGFGESPLQGEGSTMENMADQIITTLKSLDVRQKIFVVGVSMGGYVSLPLVRKYPDRVEGLILVSTRAAADSDAARAKRYENIKLVEDQGIHPIVENMMTAGFSETTLKTRPPFLIEARKWMEENSPEGIIAALKGMAQRPDSTPFLSNLSIPTCVISGGDDKLAPPEEMKAMAELIRESEFHVIEKAGHLLNIEKPEEFNSLVLDFVKTVPSTEF